MFFRFFCVLFLKKKTLHHTYGFQSCARHFVASSILVELRVFKLRIATCLAKLLNFKVSKNEISKKQKSQKSQKNPLKINFFGQNSNPRKKNKKHKKKHFLQKLSELFHINELSLAIETAHGFMTTRRMVEEESFLFHYYLLLKSFGVRVQTLNLFKLKIIMVKICVFGDF